MNGVALHLLQKGGGSRKVKFLRKLHEKRTLNEKDNLEQLSSRFLNLNSFDARISLIVADL